MKSEIDKQETPFLQTGSRLRQCLQSVWIYRILRFLLGMIFIWSGLTKITNPDSFASVIEAYGLIPNNLSLVTAVLLSTTEIFAGMGLLFDIRGSLLLTAAMSILFLGILSYGLWLGLDVDCGCFGPEDPEAGAFHNLRSAIFRDILMLITIFYMYSWRFLSQNKPIRLKTIIELYNFREK